MCERECGKHNPPISTALLPPSLPGEDQNPQNFLFLFQKNPARPFFLKEVGKFSVFESQLKTGTEAERKLNRILKKGSSTVVNVLR